MDTFIAVVVGVAAIILLVVTSTLVRFESSKNIEFRRLEAERERKWLDYQFERYNRHHRRLP